MLFKLKQSLTSILMMADSTANHNRVWNPESAATALLIEVARADQCFDESEWTAIEQTLINVLNTDTRQIKQHLITVQEELNEATCLHEMTSIINDEWDFVSKLKLLEAMWKVVLVDQHIDPNEQHLMRKIKGLLHIPQSEYIAAKLRARKALEVAPTTEIN